MKRLIYMLLLLLPQWSFAQYKAKCFRMTEGLSCESVHVGIETSCDTSIYFTTPNSVSELYISGIVSLKNKNSGHVRVILQDDYNTEYLIYETYPLLADSTIMHIQKTALETKVLDNLTPQSIRIETENAMFVLDSVYYVKGTSRSSKKYAEKAFQIQTEQCQYIVDKLNSNLEKRNMPWRAGVTSVSKMTYEEKKGMFGGNVPNLNGFEHYIGGIYVMQSEDSLSVLESSSNTRSQYVKEWDWRNRHGKNWTTTAKNQGGCGACWVFAAIGTLEAYINLYYNRLLGYDLSEQEIVSCDAIGNGCSGSVPYVALGYVKYHGVVEENCFSYVGKNGICSDKCENPSEKITIKTIETTTGFDNLKKAIFKSPVCIRIGMGSDDHAVSLVGFKDIEYGDSLFITPTNFIVITDSNYIGQTAWLIKNSWGTSWGTQGFGYVISTPDLLIYSGSTGISGRVYSMRYNNSDIMVTDDDGDGYYFWGIGPKPAHCPNWVPSTPDGDDSDYSKGPMDAYGYLQETADLLNDTIFITADTIWNQQRFLYSHVVVTNNATLTVNDSVTFYQDVTMTLLNGGKLTLNGGHLLNAVVKINGNTANSVNISNNGSIELRQGESFSLPLGNNMNIGYGKIQ